MHKVSSNKNTQLVQKPILVMDFLPSVHQSILSSPAFAWHSLFVQLPQALGSGLRVGEYGCG